MHPLFTAQRFKQLAPILAFVLAALLLLITLTACFADKGASTLGNGQVDAVEAATLRVAVGLAFTARPDTALPAYTAATAVLVVLGKDSESVPASIIDQVIADKLNALNLDPATRASFNDLALLIKARIVEQLGTGSTGAEKAVVVRDIVEIVRETAAARLELAGR